MYLLLLSESAPLWSLIFMKSSLFILPDFAYNLVVEVLHYVKIIKHRLNVGAAILKSLLEVTVHVAGDCLDAIHPLNTYKSGLSFGLDEFLSIYGVLFFQPL